MQEICFGYSRGRERNAITLSVTSIFLLKNLATPPQPVGFRLPIPPPKIIDITYQLFSCGRWRNRSLSWIFYFASSQNISLARSPLAPAATADFVGARSDSSTTYKINHPTLTCRVHYFIAGGGGIGPPPKVLETFVLPLN